MANTIPSAVKARVTSQAITIPSAAPMTVPMAAVMRLSSRISARVCARVIPSARRTPSSRVRSWIDRTVALAIPSSAITTVSASSA